MKKILLIAIGGILIFAGALFFVHQESWIIFNFPSLTNKITIPTQHTQNKSVQLWIWQQNKFKHETTEIVYGDDIAKTLQQIINNWFALLEEEQIIPQSVSVQSVALSASKQEAFISLQQYPFNRQASTYEKLHLMESMLKTIKQAELNITQIRLLLHHQPLLDEHLNFDISWPITGYLA